MHVWNENKERKRMKKILLVDYQGACDKLHNPIGHSVKVLKEYKKMIDDDYAVSVAAPDCIIQHISKEQFQNMFTLKYEILEEGKKKLFRKLTDKIKMFSNLSQLKKYDQFDMVWFYNTNFFLFLYFFLHRMPLKSFCLVCSNNFGSGCIGGFLKKIYRISIKKFAGVIYTQKGLLVNHDNTMYMPDYYYDKEAYEKYRVNHKRNKVVCLGTMNYSKELDKLVKTFNKNEYQLEIIGRFHNPGEFQILKKNAKDNIIIRNEIVDEKEYYQILGEAKFSVLPYNMDYYSERTSGVLLESIFVGTIPIAPKELLDSNDMKGIGYNALEDITYDLLKQSYDKLQREIIDKAETFESKQEIQVKLKKLLQI